MTTFGLTPQGLVVMTNDDLSTGIDQDLRAAFGQSIDTSPQSVFGQLKAIMAERLADLWTLAQAVNAQQDPDQATGAGLDGVAAITGTLREGALPSVATLTLTGTPGTLVAAGHEASVVVTQTKFATSVDATIVLATSYTPTTISTGARVTNGGNIYLCTIPGISSVGPSGTGSDIIDGAGPVHWRWLGAGTGFVDVAADSITDGPFIALSGTITVIETPVSGWNGVINILDAAVGAYVEDDPAFRIRREVELEQDGDATLGAIRAKMFLVDADTQTPVTACIVFQNSTMLTDPVTHLPPKSVEVLVQGGIDADLYQGVLDAVGAGIETYGTQSATINDAGGNPILVKFSRPVAKPIYVTLNVEVDPQLFPNTGAAQIQTAIGTLVFPIGKGVSASYIASKAWVVPGILNIPLPFIGIAPSPGSSATIVAGTHDLATFDVSRVIVNITNGTEGNP